MKSFLCSSSHTAWDSPLACLPSPGHIPVFVCLFSCGLPPSPTECRILCELNGGRTGENMTFSSPFSLLISFCCFLLFQPLSLCLRNPRAGDLGTLPCLCSILPLCGSLFVGLVVVNRTLINFLLSCLARACWGTLICFHFPFS